MTRPSCGALHVQFERFATMPDVVRLTARDLVGSVRRAPLQQILPVARQPGRGVLCVDICKRRVFLIFFAKQLAVRWAFPPQPRALGEQEQPCACTWICNWRRRTTRGMR